jgi:proline iminopeptidase
MLTARDRYLAFRRTLPRSPGLVRQTVRVRGLDFAVFTTPPIAGTTPLVCVNGGLLFSHSLLWPALAPLARGRQLVLYDQRGRGESAAPPGLRAARIEHDAGDLRVLRAALGLGQWDVLGHSWGGGIAMLGAEQDRDGVRKLVLVDSVPPTGSWLPELHQAALSRLDPTRRAVLERLDPAALASPEADPSIHSAYARALYPAWFADPELGSMFVPPRSASRTGATVAARLRREGYDWRRILCAVSTPSLVLHGDRDLLPVEVAKEIVAVLGNARLALVPDAGHMPFWESPKRFFALVDAFLTAAAPIFATTA